MCAARGFYCSGMYSLKEDGMIGKQGLQIVPHDLTVRMVFELIVGCWYCSTVCRVSHAT